MSVRFFPLPNFCCTIWMRRGSPLAARSRSWCLTQADRAKGLFKNPPQGCCRPGPIGPVAQVVPVVEPLGITAAPGQALASWAKLCSTTGTTWATGPIGPDRQQPCGGSGKTDCARSAWVRCQLRERVRDRGQVGKTWGKTAQRRACRRGLG